MNRVECLKQAALQLPTSSLESGRELSTPASGRRKKADCLPSSVSIGASNTIASRSDRWTPDNIAGVFALSRFSIVPLVYARPGCSFQRRNKMFFARARAKIRQ